MNRNNQESRKQILKSTGILGSAQLIIILLGIVRVKVLAILLGPAGVGIAGLYQTTIDLIRSATGFGIGYSSVRDIASSAATNDQKKIATTAYVLRKWTWATGLFGMLLTIIFSRQLSYLAFGNDSHSLNISLLSVVLLMSAISSGQGALLQGLRKIGDMAKANVLGALSGLAGAVVIYFFLGVDGIVSAILLTYLLTLFITWHFSKKIKMPSVSLSYSEILNRGKSMASLGFFMTITGLASAGTMYLVRSFLMKQGGVESVGHFVAAWSISSMYISAIFGAMSSDYFPRLSAVHEDSNAVAKMVNEQTEVAILITAPIIIGMVSFIDVVVRIFYSKDFGPTAHILDWQLVGDFFKVLSWPIGFLILAKGKGKIFIGTELCWNFLYCIGVYLGWKYFGIQVTGISFFISYVLLTLLVFMVARNLANFTWSSKVRNFIFVFLPLLCLSFLNVKYLESPVHYISGAILTVIALGFSLHHLQNIVDIKSIVQKYKNSK